MEFIELICVVWAAIDSWIKTNAAWAGWAQAVVTTLTVVVAVWLHFHQADKEKIREINKVNWALFEKSNLFYLMKRALDDVMEMTKMDVEQPEFSLQNSLLVYRIKEINEKCQQLKPSEMPSAASVFSQIELKRHIEEILTLMNKINEQQSNVIISTHLVSLVYECGFAKRQIAYIDDVFNEVIKTNKQNYKKRTNNVVIGG